MGERFDKYEYLQDLMRRRGFAWGSFEIYGGSRGFYDYGPLGATIKRKIEKKIREAFIREGFFEIETPDITPEQVFIASGHVEKFVDPIVECKKCGARFRADHLIEETLGIDVEGKSAEEMTKIIREHNIKCPECGGELGDVFYFNLMFETYIGPYKDKKAYLRPETAQGIFVNFKRLNAFARNKLPFGVFQIGKAYRNEISPRQGMIRLREFTQAEVEIFFNPNETEHPHFDEVKHEKLRLYPIENQLKDLGMIELTAEEAVKKGYLMNTFFAYYLVMIKKILLDIGIPEDKIRFRQQLPEERAHYSADTWDAEVYSERFGWVECVGLAYRTDYDLSRHMKMSGADLTVMIHYDKPKIVKRLKVSLNMKSVGPKLKKDAKRINEKIQAMSEEELRELVKKLNEEGKIVIDGYELSKDDFIIKEVEEKVTGEKIIPHVLEPSFGIDRPFYLLLENSLTIDEDGRIYLKIKKDMAPIEVAVLPLVAKEPLTKIAYDLFRKLQKEGFIVVYDEKDSIGKRYMRYDEIGTPYCVTIDNQTPIDGTVTIRDRDTREQIRVKLEDVPRKLKELIFGS
ncbi:glycine--tRNA ligase [Pyrococcus abyssi]|uniref:Glycine--tRNA ligase n=1 Tax=Pyrococcus abyssi (strain GE5 / Orsay) TaxID=272844 RepID=SYG_PYRAB|nr:glycine--tRNA ligase [Pyrococcus abyssi]Q9V176.1 RecName: Full=Glycine--tRNA ligase; AltName: Full=Glycyl-tRNA synthetase; Short=GlyRS [Pyrococcus abyssi GE5]CAB49474.1 glyS glycyl-tRNA synthetase [Pyrococcus abyssi GE5]CCE69941.1 TPA: glycyl-tRNA synthetase [Pyrococcus abyssi GE5]